MTTRRLLRRLVLAAAAALGPWTAGLPAAAVAASAPGDPSVEGAAVNAIPEDVIRGVVERYVREQVEGRAAHQATASDGAEGALAGRWEIAARWQGDILLDEPAAVDFQVRRLSNRPFRGPTVVRLELLADSRLLRALTVTVDCRLLRDVVVTQRVVRREEELAAAAVGVEERDITNLKDGFFTDPAQLAGLRAARPIGVGDIVTRAHAELVPVVHRGDDVVLELSTGSMSLLVTGVALQDGGQGERIRVRNADSGKVVFGQVIDANTVRVTGG